MSVIMAGILLATVYIPVSYTHLDVYKRQYKKRMNYAADRVNRVSWMSVKTPPKGSFYLFINIKESGLSSAQASEMILDKAHVLLLPGNAFGRCGEGYLRLACTVGIQKLGEAFDRIEKITLDK